MTTVRIIGDVHGKWKRYRDLTRNVPFSLQVGDFGFKREHGLHLQYRDSSRHKVCFGNHDDYTYLNAAHSMKNYGSFHGIFCIRGAYSIDRAHRLEGFSWWANEQMTYAEMMEAMDAYEAAKPKIVVTHDCPSFLYPFMGYLPEKLNHTSQFLAQCWEIHKPDMWIYGHHHKSNTKQWGPTTFICLAELEYLDLEVD